jgi:transposase InsO family protein
VPTSTSSRFAPLLNSFRSTTESGALKNLGFDYTAHFRSLLQAAGVHLLRLPANSPTLNAYAERFVRSITQDCLRHIIPLSERHLLGFVEHYHAERNHQGLANVIPFPSRDSFTAVGRIARRQRLGGLLSFYERNAA